LKKRKLNRLNNFDYTTQTVYFVTTNTHKFKHHFGKVINGEMHLNSLGRIVQNQLLWLEENYSYVQLHNYVIMPNHVHILMEINQGLFGWDNSLGSTDRSLGSTDRSRPVRTDATITKIKSLSSLIGAFKTTSSKQIHLCGNLDFNWHRSFYDVIVKDEIAFNKINCYIIENPIKWKLDKLNVSE
jgi:REP element-mobilizing transposase RayT